MITTLLRASLSPSGRFPDEDGIILTQSPNMNSPFHARRRLNTRRMGGSMDLPSVRK